MANETGVQGSYKYLELGTPGEERSRLVSHEYQLYQRLCLAKHVNPVAERKRYFTEGTRGQQLRLTPFASGSRIKEARLGILLALRSAILAIWVFHKCHVRTGPGDDPRMVVLRSAASQEVRKTLAGALEQEFIIPLAQAVGNDDSAKARAAAALAVLAGFDMIRTVLGIDAINEPKGQGLLVDLLELCLESRVL